MTQKQFEELPVGTLIQTAETIHAGSSTSYNQFTDEDDDLPIGTIFRIVATPTDRSVRAHIIINGEPQINTTGEDGYAYLKFFIFHKFKIYHGVLDNIVVY